MVFWLTLRVKMDRNFDEITEQLLLQPYWVIDFLPDQVPQDSRGRFFAVEQYFLTGARHERLCRQLADVVLKLNCYHDLTVNRGGDDWVRNPEPETLVEWLNTALHHGHLCALIDDGAALITASGGDTHLTLYNPSPDQLHLAGQLATAAGLHLWQPNPI